MFLAVCLVFAYFMAFDKSRLYFANNEADSSNAFSSPRIIEIPTAGFPILPHAFRSDENSRVSTILSLYVGDLIKICDVKRLATFSFGKWESINMCLSNALFSFCFSVRDNIARHRGSFKSVYSLIP